MKNLKDLRDIYINVAKRVLAYLFITKTRAPIYKSDNKDCFGIYTDCKVVKSTCEYIIKYVFIPIS